MCTTQKNILSFKLHKLSNKQDQSDININLLTIAVTSVVYFRISTTLTTPIGLILIQL
jgi:hypothetical protein